MCVCVRMYIYIYIYICIDCVEVGNVYCVICFHICFLSFHVSELLDNSITRTNIRQSSRNRTVLDQHLTSERRVTHYSVVKYIQSARADITWHIVTKKHVFKIFGKIFKKYIRVTYNSSCFMHE